MKRTKTNTKKILSFDPGTLCGWSFTRERYGIIDLSRKKDESWGVSLLRFQKILNELVALTEPDIISYEKPGGRNYAGIVSHAKIVGEIEKTCTRLKIPYKGYSAGEVKKFATGKGNAGKPLMIQAAKDKLGYTGDDDNEADALWIRELTISYYG